MIERGACRSEADADVRDTDVGADLGIDAVVTAQSTPLQTLEIGQSRVDARSGDFVGIGGASSAYGGSSGARSVNHGRVRGRRAAEASDAAAQADAAPCRSGPVIAGLSTNWIGQVVVDADRSGHAARRDHVLGARGVDGGGSDVETSTLVVREIDRVAELRRRAPGVGRERRARHIASADVRALHLTEAGVTGWADRRVGVALPRFTERRIRVADLRRDVAAVDRVRAGRAHSRAGARRRTAHR